MPSCPTKRTKESFFLFFTSRDHSITPSVYVLRGLPTNLQLQQSAFRQSTIKEREDVEIHFFVNLFSFRHIVAGVFKKDYVIVALLQLNNWADPQDVFFYFFSRFHCAFAFYVNVMDISDLSPDCALQKRRAAAFSFALSSTSSPSKRFVLSIVCCIEPPCHFCCVSFHPSFTTKSH